MKRSKTKIVYSIAIMILVVAVTLSFVSCKSKDVEVNIPEGIGEGLGDRAYGYMQALAGEELKDRTLGTQGEFDAAKYIAGVMAGFGYESKYTGGDIAGLQEFKTSFKRFSGDEINDATAYNVIFSKQATSSDAKGEIILACGYDNLYSEKSDISGSVWGADGSYESGASTAVMLTLAEQLKDIECDYDLTFAFFTGACYTWKGAMNYVDNLDRVGLDRIAFVLNFAMLGGGTNLYIYSGENETSYGSFWNKCGHDRVSSVPQDKNVGQFILSDDAIFNYSNIGMLSNQYFFDVKGVPSANFLSLEWEVNDKPFFSEIKGVDNVYHTANDTLQKMTERMGEDKIKNQLEGVIATTLTAFDDSNRDTLASTLDVAKSELPSKGAQSGKSSTLANVIIKVVLIAALIALSYVIKSNLTKNIDKLTAAKKAKEAQEKGEHEVEEPFAAVDSEIDVEVDNSVDIAKRNSENEEKDDPFI